MESRYLYRGKRIDNGEWVEGYLSYPFCTEKGNESYYFYAKDSLDFFCRCVVDASTICQCTGLKDKNGKLILENDILSGHIDVEFPEDETRKRVVWHVAPLVGAWIESYEKSVDKIEAGVAPLVGAWIERSFVSAGETVLASRSSCRSVD